MANFIIFHDEGGVGVQLGDEKQYITEEIANAIGKDIAVLEAQIRALDTDNIKLRGMLESNKEILIKYGIIQTLVADNSH